MTQRAPQEAARVRAKRVFYFVPGALIGGVIGSGIVTSGRVGGYLPALHPRSSFTIGG